MSEYDYAHSTAAQPVRHRNEFEVTGVVKWFCPSKGYGFVVPESASPGTRRDVFVHKEVLKRFGCEHLMTGARVRCIAHRHDKGDQARKIISIEEGDEPGVPQPDEIGWEEVIVKFFDSDRGFGFLERSDDQRDVYVHLSKVRESGFRTLNKGQVLEVCYREEHEKGKCPVATRLLGH